MLGCWAILSLVVSGGGSPEACPGGHAEQPCRPRDTAQEVAPGDHPFSSFFSSFRKRQSVPWAMIFCGRRLDHPGLVQAQGIEAHRVLGVVLAPLAVGISCIAWSA